MNADFPRVLTLLRKERGISQKLAASQLCFPTMKREFVNVALIFYAAALISMVFPATTC